MAISREDKQKYLIQLNKNIANFALNQNTGFLTKEIKNNEGKILGEIKTTAKSKLGEKNAAAILLQSKNGRHRIVVKLDQIDLTNVEGYKNYKKSLEEKSRPSQTVLQPQPVIENKPPQPAIEMKQQEQPTAPIQQPVQSVSPETKRQEEKLQSAYHAESLKALSFLELFSAGNTTEDFYQLERKPNDAMIIETQFSKYRIYRGESVIEDVSMETLTIRGRSLRSYLEDERIILHTKIYGVLPPEKYASLFDFPVSLFAGLLFSGDNDTIKKVLEDESNNFSQMISYGMLSAQAEKEEKKGERWRIGEVAYTGIFRIKSKDDGPLTLGFLYQKHTVGSSEAPLVKEIPVGTRINETTFKAFIQHFAVSKNIDILCKNNNKYAFLKGSDLMERLDGIKRSRLTYHELMRRLNQDPHNQNKIKYLNECASRLEFKWVRTEPDGFRPRMVSEPMSESKAIHILNLLQEQHPENSGRIKMSPSSFPMAPPPAPAAKDMFVIDVTLFGFILLPSYFASVPKVETAINDREIRLAEQEVVQTRSTPKTFKMK